MATDAAGEFSSFYELNRRRVIAELIIMVGDRREAEDVAQEAFARAWGKWSRLSGYADPHAWVLTVAHRLAISRWRRVQTGARLRHKIVQADRVDPAEPLAADVVSALRRLPLAQQRALVLYHVADRSVADIALAEGVAEGTIKARLARGRTALAPLLADTDDLSDQAPRLIAPPMTEGNAHA